MKSGIDAINKHILRDLLIDGKKSFTDIARECGKSKDVITKRFNQMEKKGIIVGATIQNSPACFDGNFVAGIQIFTHADKSGEAISIINRIPQIFAVYNVGVNPSLAASAVLKNIQELEAIKQAIKNLPFILGVKTEVWATIKNNPENLSLLKTLEPGASVEENETKKLEKTQAKIDDLDKQIISKLALNARMHFNKIAKELGTSTDTIARRYEKLKQNGNLKVVIQIDPSKIGYSAYANIKLSFASEDASASVMDKIASIPDVNLVIRTIGDYDYTVSLMVKDIDQLIAAQRKIANIKNLTKMDVMIEKLFNTWPLNQEFITT